MTTIKRTFQVPVELDEEGVHSFDLSEFESDRQLSDLLVDVVCDLADRLDKPVSFVVDQTVKAMGNVG